MGYKNFAQWALYALLSFFSYQIWTSLDRMGESVAKLNENVAVIVYQVADHNESIKEIKRRIESLERPNPSTR